MATDRRRFLELRALGVPAATRAMRQVSTAAIQPGRDSKDETEEYVIPLDLVSGVREHIWEGGASIHLIRSRSKRVAGEDTAGDWGRRATSEREEEQERLKR